MKGTGAHATRRSKTRRHLATQRTKATSPKAREVVRLVHALSTELGSSDGVAVGRGIVDLVTQAYRDRGLRLPRWVTQLATHYTATKRSP